MKAVIFDLDGTLVDSIESIAYCANKAIATLGFDPIEKERYKYFVGDGAKELLRRTLQAVGAEEELYYDKVRKAYKEIFEQDCNYLVKPYDGIQEVLKELKSRGIRLAVLSNKPHARTLDVVAEFFEEGTFEVVQGETREVERKPSPAGVFAIAKKMQLSLEDFCYVGDTNTDMKTGKAAGVFTIGVLWGFRDRQELEENHADAIIEVPEELIAFCDKKIY